MRFGLLHRVATDALGALSLIALLTSGLVDLPTTLVFFVLFALGIAVPTRLREATNVRRGVATALVLGVTALVARRHAPLATVFEVLALALIARLASRRGARDDASLAVLALLGFVAASLVAPIAYVVSFVGLVIVAPAALTLSHLRREVEGNHRQGARDRSGMPVDVARILRSKRVVGRGFLIGNALLAIPILAVVLLFFVFTPRFAPSMTALGLNDAIDLSSNAPVSKDATVVLRFTTNDSSTAQPDRLPLRFRGAALVDLDGPKWRHRSGASVGDTLTLVRSPNEASDRKVTIDLGAIDPPLVLVPHGTVALSTDTPIERGLDGELRTRDVRGIQYVAWIGTDEPAASTLTSAERARALALPSDFPSRIRALAHSWTDDAPSADAKARAIEHALKSGYRYDVASSARSAPNAIDAFLFDARSGHCELFATSMAAMLREVGVPSRVVTGFVGGEYNRFGGFYAVRQRDAHAWVEAYVDGAWRTYDPTPTATLPPIERGVLATMHEMLDTYGFGLREHVLRYDGNAQVAVVARYRGALVLAVALVFAALLLFHARRWRGRRSPLAPEAKKPELDEAACLYKKLEEMLTRRGIVRDPAMTPSQLVASLEAAKDPAAPEIRKLTEIYLAARFGRAPITESTRVSFLRRVEALSALG